MDHSLGWSPLGKSREQKTEVAVSAVRKKKSNGCLYSASVLLFCVTGPGSGEGCHFPLGWIWLLQLTQSRLSPMDMASAISFTGVPRALSPS